MMIIARWLPLLLAAGLGMDASAEGLVVHEWGTLTSVVGEDGVPISWHPLRQRSDLPGFVYVGIPKGRQTATVRMETPVLYFYADRETVASVRVDFPGGQITEWYPAAQWAPSRLRWSRVRIRPETASPLRREARDSHYYHARQTDAALVAVGNGAALQHERFLFYRGVGTCRLPVSLRLAGESVEVASGAEVGPVVLFERHGGLVGYRRQDVADGGAFLERPVLGDSLAALRAELQQMLVERGLYPREAAAMLATWDESWFEEGLRLFYILPGPETDALLPLSIDPQPQERVRVLVARIEILTPEMEREAEDRLAAASSGPLPGGRFTEALLRRVRDRTDDVRLRARIRRLLFSEQGGASGAPP
ncbi:MAG: hypothetical protein DMF83_14800 [Acidobacteria bacterium]|nr:MAG: hypothetical protein DMF83_14800 [Acidobacteriota bacterium]